VYVDDNGTNSRLRIDVIVAGVRTNRASTNLAARLVSATGFRFRGRIEGNTVTAEYFLGGAEPAPMAAPATTNTYALSSGEQASLPRGDTGWSWIPQNAAAVIDEFHFSPYVRRSVAFPVTPGSLQFTDLPGRAPAKADITLTTSAPAQTPIFALIGWKPSSGISPLAGSVVPFGLIEAETGGDLSGGWASTAEANTSNGSSLRQSGFTGAKVYVATYTIDPHTLVMDEFEADTVALEVWARVGVDAAVVSPKVVLWAEPADSTSFGFSRYTAEYGTAGKLLIKPSSGAAWRPSKFGTLTLPSDTLRPRAWKLWVQLSCAAGSSGLFGLDYLFIVPARSRVLSPTGKGTTGYPLFIASTSQTSKTIRSDLSGLAGSPPNNPNPDHGLGGNLLEIPLGSASGAGPGAFDLAVKLSPLVPDDPTANTNSESAVTTAATVQVDVTPRSYMLRG
jgi:hypothetical protein